ncbi:serine hydrolase domain-containing protein [Neorhizobium sp. DT-125]|uniref:serine hydrolase domain-containing protein n=1 Tax=Neorhizobium sp. DT-125 TaxID=3396163 RepID=UPI003F1AE4E6
MDVKGDGAIVSRVEAVVGDAIDKRALVGTVILVKQDGRPVCRIAAGWTDREAATPMQVHSVFRLASLTKPLVAAAAIRLVERERLDLDTPVTAFLPLFTPRLADGSAATIRVRHLLTHTAGLSYRFLQPAGSPYHAFDVSDGLDLPGLSGEENLRRLAQVPLLYEPGQGWGYSLGYDVLGILLERLCDTSLDEIVRRFVTRPLGMELTNFSVADGTELVVPYVDGNPEPVRMEGETIKPLLHSAVRFHPGRIRDPSSYQSGGAGMAGTAGEFMSFLEAIRLDGGPILRRSSVAMMMDDHVGAHAATQGPGWGFGLGWAVLRDSSLAMTRQSEGTIEWGGAYGHSWFIDPVQRLSVVALTNTTFEGLSGRFRTDLRNAIYDDVIPRSSF